jgi:excisionase family DNA binding protein
VTTTDTASLVLTVAEAAHLLRVSKSHVGELVRRGDLPRLANVGRRVLIPRAALERFVAGGDA